jgi:hypothetical protein
LHPYYKRSFHNQPSGACAAENERSGATCASLLENVSINPCSRYLNAHGEGRVQVAPMVRPQKRMQAAVTAGLAEHARPSLRDGFDGCSALSPGTVFVAPVIRDTVVTDLASATGCQDHTA